MAAGAGEALIMKLLDTRFRLGEMGI